MNGYRIAIALMNETKHPIWGGLFTRVITDTLKVEDIFLAEDIGRPCPTWISIIAGGNSGSLSAVADIALTDYIIEVEEIYSEIEHLARALHKSIFNSDEIGENAHLN